MKSKVFTYQTRLPSDPQKDLILDAFGHLFGTIERKLFVDLTRPHNLNSLKSSYLIKYGLTARQFNAIRISLEGKIEAARQGKIRQISELKEKIPALEKKLSKIKDKTKRHQKTRNLIARKKQLVHLEEELKENKISLCFGSKKLFRAQFFLEENGYGSLDEWSKDWKDARSSEIFCLGSKDETSGNQSCALTLKDGKCFFRLRLPNALSKEFGKYIAFENIVFSYGQKEIQQALEKKTALNYRLKKDEKGWRIFISFKQEQAQVITRKEIGAIGIDINADHIALAEIDAKGNPVYKETISLNTYGKRKNQAKAIIGEAVSKAAQHSLKTGKPLVVEKLDFTKKKAALKTKGPKEARMLSSFSYSHILESIHSKSFRVGVEVLTVNPAMTSIIGKHKFAKRYGLSHHHAAAHCIARRVYSFSEAPSKSTMILIDKNVQVASSLPARNRKEHVWKYWKKIDEKTKTALAAHYRARKRSLCPSNRRG